MKSSTENIQVEDNVEISTEHTEYPSFDEWYSNIRSTSPLSDNNSINWLNSNFNGH